ncbi:MAG: crosslink repair DNA glycosylase YcaQ family protein [Acidobacteriota bacterium]
MPRKTAPPIVPVETARRLLLRGAGLLDDPDRRAGPAALRKEIQRLGFVQVDSIRVVERAHHHLLWTRLTGYRTEHLRELVEKRHQLFEHWTHDASILPVEQLGWWRHRFRAYAKRRVRDGWWKEMLGPRPRKLLRDVLARIETEGPLSVSDFEREKGEPGSWWAWQPAKAALEYLWRCGELTVVARGGNFQKIYDLTTRVHPTLDDEPLPRRSRFVAWSCEEALSRLGVATPTELGHFWGGLELAEARAWAKTAVRKKDAVAVEVETVRGERKPALAHPDWESRADTTGDPPSSGRLLSPFDPVLRDRARAERLFGFDYRFEAFVPKTKRRFGYYVLPLLVGERFRGRVDAKLHRDEGVLRLRGPWWETPPTKADERALAAAAERFRRQLGAERWELVDVSREA